jgi:Ankyrin repeat
MSIRHLPVRPNLEQLKHQAKDLLRAFRSGDPAALADFEEHYPARIEPARAKLADAQLVLARSYESPSWPRLVQACELIDAIWVDDLEAVRALVTRHPHLLNEDAAIRKSNWGPPMSYAANLGRDSIITMLHQQGASDLAQAANRAVLQGQIETARMLYGLMGNPRPPRGAAMDPCETLCPSGLAFVLDRGAEICDRHGDWRAPVSMLLQTYCRNPQGKHQCLELITRHGIELPDTPPMAVHRGRIDLLETHLQRDPALLSRTFSLEDLYPPSLGCLVERTHPFHGTPLDGATLLHMAIDYGELEIARWLIDRGMDVNTKARIDSEGFGGHTPLFSCVVSYWWYLRSKYATPKPTDDLFTELLLARGADPKVRASLRTSIHDTVMHEYRDVTPLTWGEQFHARELVCDVAMRMIAQWA